MNGCRLSAFGVRQEWAGPAIRGAAVLAAALLLVLTGCASSSSQGLEQAVQDYDAGRYDEAERGAGAVMRRSTGDQRARAAYVAGVSAYQLSRTDDAERYVLDAATSEDPATAARAEAMLGLIRLDQQRPGDAEEHFDRAGLGLSGTDAARAVEHAHYAHLQGGRSTGWYPSSYSSSYSSSSSSRSSSSWPPSTSDAASSRGVRFTIQAGAFRQHGRAQRTATEISTLVSAQGYGPVHIIEQPDGRGRTMYHVQFGRFNDRRQAADARSRLGRLDFIVAPMQAF